MLVLLLKIHQKLFYGNGRLDSTLSNLLVEGVVEEIQGKVQAWREKKPGGAPAIYLPKIVEELQIEQLPLRDILQVMERHPRCRENPNFRVENIITHVVIPHVPDELWDIYGSVKKTKRII